jgi:hypothetical protein
MALKLNNQIVDDRLANRPIKRLGEYIKVSIPILFQCLIETCGHIWNAKPNNIFNGRGCPKCSGHLKVTNEDVDIKLKDRDVKRIGNYINSIIPIEFLCLKSQCNYTWLASPSSVLYYESNCPKCAGILKLTNDEVDRRLIGRNIKRLGEYKNYFTKIKFQCLLDRCKYIWNGTPSDILNGCGCPNCAGKILPTNKELKKILLSFNIKALDTINIKSEKIQFKCLNKSCNYIWKNTLSKILNNKRNIICPECYKQSIIDDIDHKLHNYNIKRIGNFTKRSGKTLFECLNCLHRWETTITTILCNETGCPNCCSSKNENAVGNILLSSGIKFFRHYYIKYIIPDAKKIFVDFYFPSLNIIIEYNGYQHYEPVRFGGISKKRAQDNFIKQKIRDKYLAQFCKINNITLIWIDGRSLKRVSKLQEYVKNIIIPQLKKIIH